MSNLQRSTMTRAGLVLALLAGGLVAVTASCGSDRPLGAGDGTRNPSECLTPQAGCSCTPGLTVPCGHTVHGADNFVYCYQGTRTCSADGRFGECLNGTLAAQSIRGLSATASGIHALALGTPVACASLGDGGLSGDGGPTTFPPTAFPACAAAAPGTGADCDCTGAPLTCGLGCGGNSTCNAIARVGKTADFNCGGNTTCDFKCESGSTCDVNCSGNSNCAITCPPGATCNISCSGNANCPCNGTCNVVSCTGSASCPIVPTNAGANPDPCDPYCHVRIDDPTGLPLDGGFGLTPDGGLVVLGGDAGPAVPGVPQFNGNGSSACGGAQNAITNPCNVGNPIANCQQDFRCVGTTCVWNGGEGYYDPTIAPPAIDLTIGAGCDYAGPPAQDLLPLCNRGNLAVPPNRVIGVNITPGIEDGCSVPHATFDCAVNVGATGLAPGACVNVGGCPVSANKNAVVNAMGRDIAEAPGRCANNASAVKFTGALGCTACQPCDTTLTGKVYDPSSGLPALAEVNNLPLAGISVFSPSGTLTALTDGVQCDTCTSLDSPRMQYMEAVTDATGSFTLPRITPGPSTRIVAQSGRWRREITVPITACTANAPAAGTFRMPRDKTDFPAGGSSDLPKIAIVTGFYERLECLVRRLGITSAGANNEMKGRATSADTNRIQIWDDKGMTTAGPVAKVVDGAANGLFTQPVLDEYAAILFDCDGDGTNPFGETSSAAQKAMIETYVNKGGRAFVDHWSAWWLVRNNTAGFAGTSTWTGSASLPDIADNAYIQIGTPAQQLFADWMNAAGVSATAPAGSLWTTVIEGKETAVNPTAGQTTQWLRGDTATSWSAGAPPAPPVGTGSHSLSYSFETPIGGNCGAPTGTGRMIVNSMHVSAARGTGTGGVFPGACIAQNLAPEEKALTYQFFQLTACALGGAPPPPPPPVVPVPLLPLSTTYSVDFVAQCNIGEVAVWQLFQWKAFIPPGTSIAFRAATADNVGLLPPSPPAGLPTTVPIGTANNANAFTDATGWTYDTSGAAAFTPRPVSYHLANDPAPPQKSKNALRVYMTFNTTGVISPILFSWRQLFDCVPAE